MQIGVFSGIIHHYIPRHGRGGGGGDSRNIPGIFHDEEVLKFYVFIRSFDSSLVVLI